MHLMHLNEKILKNIESNKVTAVLFMDLKAAFDTVNHEILLKKLEHMGFRDSMLELLKSYLTGRKQYVKNGDVESVLLDVVCGVPQGSVLGPLLFTLYINDIVGSSGLESVLFADDAALIAAEHTLKKLQKIINTETPKLFDWLCSSKLTLNYTKTKYMLFGLDNIKAKNKFKKVKFKININKNAISRVNEFKYLGVIIDEKLSWKNHISYIQSKLAKVSGIIYKSHKKMSKRQ